MLALSRSGCNPIDIHTVIRAKHKFDLLQAVAQGLAAGGFVGPVGGTAVLVALLGKA